MDIQRIEAAASQVTRRLSRGDGVDEDEAAALTSSLRDAVRSLKSTDLIPRRDVGVLYELTLMLDNAAASYDGTAEGSAVSRLRFEVTELVRECFAQD